MPRTICGRHWAVLNLRLQQARESNLPDWPAIDRDVARLARVVGQLLDLARKEAACHANAAPREGVDLTRIAREAAAPSRHWRARPDAASMWKCPSNYP